MAPIVLGLNERLPEVVLAGQTVCPNKVAQENLLRLRPLELRIEFMR